MDNTNIIKDINKLDFIVELMHGTINIGTPNREDSHHRKICSSMEEANFYSLNILRQNVNEELFKTGEQMQTISRYVCGERQLLSVDSIIPTMKWLQETFPEKFI